uniref:Reverse transcriptase domain-containing protein n=1 Tax=Caulerpa verticillata TaxID=177082 RepID=A0A386B0A6_9CHLO|nr:hypothetical protein [Caulerpa verticillata]AYC65136.1 hypothetical protein [Caulerpa verticillata]
MVFFTPTLEDAHNSIKGLKQFLISRGLTINEKKTKITDMEYESFKFVGYEFKKIIRRNRKIPRTYVSIPKKSIRSIKQRIREIPDDNKNTGISLRKSNQTLRGWANFYSHAFDKDLVYPNL